MPAAIIRQVYPIGLDPIGRFLVNHVTLQLHAKVYF